MSLKTATSIVLLCSLVFLVIALTSCSYTKEYLQKIDYSALKNKISNNENFVLYISNKSCTHCKTFEPKFRKIINKYKFTAYKIDTAALTVDQYNEIIIGYIGEVGTPTVSFFEKGEDKGSYSRINGDVSDDKIIEKLKANDYIKD